MEWLYNYPMLRTVGPFFHPVAVLLALLIVTGSTSKASNGKAIAISASERDFFESLACRNQAITMGPELSGAFISDSLQNSLKIEPFRISNEGAFLPLGPVEIPSAGSIQQVWWTQKNDLVLYRGDAILYGSPQAVQLPASPIPLRKISLTKYLPLMQLDDDVSPSHIVRLTLARTTTSEKLLVADFTRSRVIPESVPLDGSPYVSDGDADILRERISSDGQHKTFEYYDASHNWSQISRTAVPTNARALLLRRNARGVLEAVVQIDGFGADPDKIISITNNAAEPRVLFEGIVTRVKISPQGRDVWGAFDNQERFHPIFDQPRGAAIRFWIKRINSLKDVIDFELSNSGRVAILKKSQGAYAPSFAVSLLDHKGQVRELHTECENVTRGLEKVFVSENSYLFLPRALHSDQALVVYLHGGPLNYVNERGNWITDILNLSGFPVLAVNYSGSLGTPSAAKGRIDNIFAREILNSVAFASSKLKWRKPRLVVLGDSFGTLVGLAAITSGKLKPAAFISIDGLVEPSRLLANLSGRPNATYNFFSRVGNDLETKLLPGENSEKTREMRLLFVHGANDVTAPVDDVTRFVREFNSARKANKAELKLIGGMYHSPTTKKEYSEIFSAVNLFLQPYRAN